MEVPAGGGRRCDPIGGRCPARPRVAEDPGDLGGSLLDRLDRAVQAVPHVCFVVAPLPAGLERRNRGSASRFVAASPRARRVARTDGATSRVGSGVCLRRNSSVIPAEGSPRRRLRQSSHGRTRHPVPRGARLHPSGVRSPGPAAAAGARCGAPRSAIRTGRHRGRPPRPGRLDRPGGHRSPASGVHAREQPAHAAPRRGRPPPAGPAPPRRRVLHAVGLASRRVQPEAVGRGDVRDPLPDLRADARRRRVPVGARRRADRSRPADPEALPMLDLPRPAGRPRAAPRRPGRCRPGAGGGRRRRGRPPAASPRPLPDTRRRWRAGGRASSASTRTASSWASPRSSSGSRASCAPLRSSRRSGSPSSTPSFRPAASAPGRAGCRGSGSPAARSARRSRTRSASGIRGSPSRRPSGSCGGSSSGSRAVRSARSRRGSRRTCGASSRVPGRPSSASRRRARSGRWRTRPGTRGASTAGTARDPRIRLLMGQPPLRFSQERLAAAYHGTCWALGREAAGLLPLEPLAGLGDPGAVVVAGGGAQPLPGRRRAADGTRWPRRPPPRRRGARGAGRRGARRHRRRLPALRGAGSPRRTRMSAASSSSSRTVLRFRPAHAPGQTASSTRSRAGAAIRTSCPVRACSRRPSDPRRARSRTPTPPGRSRRRPSRSSASEANRRATSGSSGRSSWAWTGPATCGGWWPRPRHAERRPSSRRKALRPAHRHPPMSADWRRARPCRTPRDPGRGARRRRRPGHAGRNASGGARRARRSRSGRARPRPRPRRADPSDPAPGRGDRAGPLVARRAAGSGDRRRPARRPGGVGRLQPPVHGRAARRAGLLRAGRGALLRPRPARRGARPGLPVQLSEPGLHGGPARDRRGRPAPDGRAHGAARAPRERRPPARDVGLAGAAGAGPQDRGSDARRLPRRARADGLAHLDHARPGRGPRGGRLHLVRPRTDRVPVRGRVDRDARRRAPPTPRPHPRRTTASSGSWRWPRSAPSWSATSWRPRRSSVPRWPTANWHLILWPYLRAWLERDELDLAGLEPYLGLEPAVERRGEQLGLFDRPDAKA